VKAKHRRIAAILVLLAAAAAGYLWLVHGPTGTAVSPPAADSSSPSPSSRQSILAAETQPPADRPTPTPAPVYQVEAAQPDEAAGCLQRGLELMNAGKLLEARGELSKAIFSGALDEAQAEQARAAAAKVADATIFSPQIVEGDPYVFQYTFQSGEILNKVERKLNLHVPPQLIVKINRLPNDRSIRAGATVKMVQGPFHAIVSKSHFTIDLYLARQGLDPVFVRRLKVGLGADGSTPVGAWKVGQGKKMINATWFPPPSSEIRRPQHPGDPNYPLGKAGHWIGLVGTDPNTAPCTGYGLHGTDDPASIGRAESLGCIRLADPDIEFVYSLLYEEWSTVQVTP